MSRISFNKLVINLVSTLALLASLGLVVLWLADAQQWLNHWQAWTPLGLLLLRSSSILFPILPSTLYSVMAGAILGLGPGILLIACADLLSCSLTFGLARRYGRPLVVTLVGERWMFRVDQLSQAYFSSRSFLTAAVMMTGLFDFASYEVGLTPTPWPRYAVALVIAVFISTPPVVAIGAGLTEHGYWLLGVALLAVLRLLPLRVGHNIAPENTMARPSPYHYSQKSAP